MTTTIEDVSRDVQMGLHNLNEEQAILTAEYLQLPKTSVEKVRGRGRMGVVRLVNRYLAREEVDEMEDGGLEVLKGLDAFVKQLTGAIEEKEVPIQKDDEGEEERAPKRKSPDPSSPPPSVPVREEDIHMAYLSRFLKREFKITGQIGEPGQKDKITFSSLNRQLEAGLFSLFHQPPVSFHHFPNQYLNSPNFQHQPLPHLGFPFPNRSRPMNFYGQPQNVHPPYLQPQTFPRTDFLHMPTVRSTYQS